LFDVALRRETMYFLQIFMVDTYRLTPAALKKIASARITIVSPPSMGGD
jgi:hypothetical protein